MPAVSESQQRLFGMVHAYQKGKLKNPPKKVKEVAKHISEEDAEHFARTKHKGLPEKKAAYLRGFMDKLAEHGMTKEAKNILRLLSRVGPDLSGATARDLKFLARRGFKGFTPEQVQAARAKGLLPSVEQELAGFNRGTENMFRFAPKMQVAGNRYNVDTSVPLKGITRTNAPDVSYQANILRRSAVIPDASAPGTLAEREIRAAIARHEAREWVRGNAALAHGRDPILPGNTGSITDIFSIPEVGSSHMPGVIYDERIFRSGLLNRLGLGTRWDRTPLLHSNGKPVFRGPRDSYAGNKPLPYEFSMIDQWRKLQNTQRRTLKGMVGITGRLHRLDDPSVRARAESIVTAALKKYRKAVPSPTDLPEDAWTRKDWPEFWNEWDMKRVLYPGGPKMWGYDHIAATNGPWKRPEVIQPYADAISRIGINEASRTIGIPKDEISRILFGEHVYAKPGSELRRLMDLPVA